MTLYRITLASFGRTLASYVCRIRASLSLEGIEAEVRKKIDPIALSLRKLIKKQAQAWFYSGSSSSSESYFYQMLSQSILSEIPTTMKFTSKAVRTLGLMVMLSAMVGTSVQQSAQAQSRNAVNPALKIACVPQAEGEIIFAFKDIKFSPRQAAEYDRLEKAYSQKIAEFDEKLPKVNIPGDPLQIVFTGGSDALRQRIGDEQAALERNKVPTAKQIELLTKKYGRFAEFSVSKMSLFTPEQLALVDKYQREYFDQIASFLTPPQQRVFRANMLRVNQFDACNPPPRTLDPAYQNKTIVDIAAGNPKFSTLVQLVKAAGLTETLSGKTQLTVFAPTNEAFAALPKGTLEKLLKPENRDTLRKVLTYHVVPGAVESQILRSGTVKSVEGSPINVQVPQTQSFQKQIKVNNATVALEDVKVSNGVIHVIDRVLLPPNLK